MATVAYIYPTASAPTANSALFYNRNVTQVILSDTETTATVTHNWAIPLSTAGPNVLGQNSGNPQVLITQLGNGTLAAIIGFTRGTNTVVLTKASATGSGGSWEVVLTRQS